jgi:hypothetical protein
MITELEEQFYKTFGIEKQKYYACKNKDYNDVFEVKYPEITDRVLLELICIIANGKDGSKNLNLYTANEDEWFAVLKDQNNLAYCAAIDKSFKNAILKLCIYRADINDFKQQIQQLFKEEE